jgi:CHAD domain-containing protein
MTESAAGAADSAVAASPDAVKFSPAMVFRLKVDEPAVSGVLRVIRKHIGRAIVEVEDAARPQSERIRRARARCRRIRALLRLVRPLSEPLYRRENRRFRDYAQPLSALRDTEILAAAFENFILRSPAPDPGEVRSARRRLAARRARSGFDAGKIERQLALFARRLRRAEGRLSHPDLKEGGIGAIAAGFAGSYRRGRRILGTVRARCTDAGLHEWRKRAKYYRYQAQLLREASPAVMRKARSRAARLSALLGEHHDLGLLRRFLLAGPAARPASAGLAGQIASRQRELAAEALRLGERLFADKPSRLRRLLDRDWRAAAP